MSISFQGNLILECTDTWLLTRETQKLTTKAFLKTLSTEERQNFHDTFKKLQKVVKDPEIVPHGDTVVVSNDLVDMKSHCDSTKILYRDKEGTSKYQLLGGYPVIKGGLFPEIIDCLNIHEQVIPNIKKIVNMLNKELRNKNS